MVPETDPLDPTTDPSSRHVALEGLFNVRDLGGYRTADGRSTQWGRLYRADGIHRAQGGDLDRLLALGLRTVIDLRTPAEVDERGRFGSQPEGMSAERADDDGDGTGAAKGADRAAEAASATSALALGYHHLPVIRESWADWQEAGDAEPVGFLVLRYLDMLDEGAPALATALEVMADRANLPAVFHCAAGKDRTGVLAAIVLSLAGVDDAEIAHDYALSGAAMEALVDWIREHVPDALDSMTDQPAAFLAAPPAAMVELLAEVRTRHGSMTGYAASIGVDGATVAALRENLLAPTR